MAINSQPGWKLKVEFGMNGSPTQLTREHSNAIDLLAERLGATNVWITFTDIAAPDQPEQFVRSAAIEPNRPEGGDQDKEGTTGAPKGVQGSPE